MKAFLLRHFRALCTLSFGSFEEAEFKKFMRMGLILGLILGVYWALRPLKDALFIGLVGGAYLPHAKTLSVIALLPIVILYTRLLSKTSKEWMLTFLPAVYAGLLILFSGLLTLIWSHGDLSDSQGWQLFGRVIGFGWYVLVESFGSLMIALFWAFAADTTGPASARRGFPFVVLMGQLGGILFPALVGTLPHYLHLKNDLLTLALLSAFVVGIIPLVRSFLKKTPKELLVAFEGEGEEAVKKEGGEKPGFFEGVRLLCRHRYLLAIFGVNMIYEVIVTIFDFNFKMAASSQYSGVELSHYLSIYGATVNVISFCSLLFGISHIARLLGLGLALALMPVVMGLVLFGFLHLSELSMLFGMLAVLKAINYALNGPTLRQLYIPTTIDVRFKTQAWIETFGLRASKGMGSLFNMSLLPLQKSLGELAGRAHYLFLAGTFGFPLLVIWLALALFLGASYKRAVEERKLIG